ncbi:hypothetical protein L6R49_30455 [Myxococcota bacterium]|nr:hypothetical protein [Myxococcota bacterium]
MRRLALVLLVALMVSPAAEANPLTILRALAKLGSGAGKVAKVGKAASMAKGLKGAASAGAAAKVSKLAVGATAGALAADAARGFAMFGDDVTRTALYVGGGESGALSVITRTGEQAVTSPMALGSALDDAARQGGKPLDLLLDPSAAMRVDVTKLPPDTRLFVMTGEDTLSPIVIVDDGVGNVRAVVKDSLENAWDLGQLVLDMNLDEDGWPATAPYVLAVTNGPCVPALAEHKPELGACDAESVQSWLQHHTDYAVVLLLEEGQDPEPYVALAEQQGHDLAALTLSALDEVGVVVINALAREEGKKHAPFMKIAPMSSSTFTPGNPAVLRGKFVSDPIVLPTLQSGIWVVHLPDEEVVEAEDLSAAEENEPPMWVYGLALVLSIPVIALMRAKGKL